MKDAERKSVISSAGETTLRKNSDEYLLYKTLFEQSPDGVLIVDTLGSFIDFNEAAHRQLGYSREEFRRLRISDIDPVESPEEIQANIQRLIESGASSAFEVKHRTKAGEVRDVYIINKPLTIAGRTVVHSIWRDITEQKRAEEALRAAHVKLEALIQAMPDLVFLKDAGGRYVLVNNAAVESFGLERDAFIGKTNDVVLPPDLVPICNSSDAEAIERGGPIHADERMVDKEGRERFFDTIKTPVYGHDGQLAGLICVARDDTDRRKAEESLLLFKNLLNQSKDAIFVNDPGTGRFLIVNDRACGNLGYSRSELLAIRTLDIEAIFPDQAAWDAHAREVKSKGSLIVEGTHKRRNGTSFPAEINVTYMTIGERDYMVAVARDISERKADEQALRDSEERFRILFESSPVSLWLEDLSEVKRFVDGLRASGVSDFAAHFTKEPGSVLQALSLIKVIDVNRATLKLYGAADKAAFLTALGSTFSEASLTAFRSGLVAVAEGRPSVVLETTTKNLQGDTLSSIIQWTVVPGSEGSYSRVVVSITDVTDLKRAEEQLLRTQKLEAVGILAGGIAHDFNNFLQGVFGSISLAKTHSEKGGKVYAMLEGAESALYQATSLTKQLLTFSKGGEPVKMVLALPSVVDNAVKFALSGSNICYRSVVDEHLWPVEVDGGQLSQVIHNIVLNACDAMPDGGTIRIAMHNVPVDERSGLPLEQGNFVSLEIADSGQGIPADNLSKIFDPYFTTKRNGSGLGLATSYSIIKKHGGAITVRSQLNAGSIFSLYLPASTRELSPEKVRVTEPIHGKGRILVMDDEDIVLSVARHMIEGLGYGVSLAENGEQALELFSDAIESNRPFDAVILDLTIRGGMGGEETLKEMAALAPSVKAIVSSGYSADDIVSHYREYGFQEVLSKPYELDVLSRLLHELLHREDPS